MEKMETDIIVVAAGLSGPCSCHISGRERSRGSCF